MQLAALAFLRAYVDKTHFGIRHALNLVHINAAHRGKLTEHFRAAFHVCAEIKEHIASVKTGNYGGKRRAFYSLYALYNKGCAHDYGSGAARAYKSIAAAVRQGLKPHRKGALFIFFQNFRRLGANGHNHGCVDELKAGNIVFLADFPHFGFISHRNDFGSQLLCRHSGAEDWCFRGVVAAVHINYNFHKTASKPAMALSASAA